MADQTETQEEQTTETTETKTEETGSETSKTEEKSEKTNETTEEPKSISQELKAQRESEKSTDDESEDSTEDEGAGDEGSSDSGAPDKYEAFTRPDKAAWSEDSGKEFDTLMKDGGLSQEKAQSVMDFVSKHGVDTVAPALLKGQAEEYAKQREEELTRAKQNPLLIGEDGEQWKTTIALVDKVVERFAGKGKEAEGVMAALESGGFLDQEAFLVLMSQIGGAMTSDTLSGGGDPALETDDAWDDMTIGQKLDHAKKKREESAAA